MTPTTRRTNWLTVASLIGVLGLIATLVILLLSDAQESTKLIAWLIVIATTTITSAILSLHLTRR